VIIVTGKMVMFQHPGHKTILYIDDDDGMLGYQGVLLEHVGMRCPPPPLEDGVYR